MFILKKNIKEGIYNASNENISIINLAKIIQNKISKRIKLKIHKSNDPRSYRLDNTKIKKTGFKFKKKIIDGIEDILHFYNKNMIKDKPSCYSINWVKKIK